jgi:DNA helicase-2/ATP-dependent DNA helicase PcrA
MESLTLSYAKLRSNWGEREYQMPSRFLDEIPEEFKSGSLPGGFGGSARGRGGWGGALPPRGEPERAASSESAAYRAGERVRHAKFGDGEVVEAGAGKVVVRFGTEEKTFVPELAPLSKT